MGVIRLAKKKKFSILRDWRIIHDKKKVTNGRNCGGRGEEGVGIKRGGHFEQTE